MEKNLYLGALKYKISDRIAKLAKPADDNTEFVDDDEFFKVRQSALKGNFKQDVEKLAQHKVRQSMDAAQFNPHAFEISEAAKKARPSRRVTELAKHRPIDG